VEPSAPLLKALLVNCAVDMTGITRFPSNSEGWGRVLGDNAIYFPGDTRQLVFADVRNADGFATILTPIVDKLAEKKGPPSAFAEAVGSRVTGAEVGLMLGFLIIHLESGGVPSSGVLGAASVFAVFSVSVIAARIALATLPDRLGPLRSAAISLCTLAAGLATLGLARHFWTAAIGAALIGIGFSPLYPSLTMLATRGLAVANRALGLGMLSSFTSVGFAGGALLGGLVISVASTTWAFIMVAGLQLAALAIVTIFSRDDSPRERPDSDAPRDPAG
jgi:hypothetical protein